jgi:hypothetical protein
MLSPHFSYEEMTRSKWAEDNGVDNTPDELLFEYNRQGTMWIHCSVCLDPKENRHQAIKNYKSYK